MPTYTMEPPADPRGNSLPLVRTPTAKPIIAIATSDHLIGTPTHFYGGRTLPCDAPDCEPCRKGVAWRWHGYFGALMAGTNLHVLFECTAVVAQQFVSYREVHGTLRGCHFKAYRASRAPNGRVTVVCKPADLAQISLPSEPDVTSALAIIWNIAAPKVDVQGLLKNVPRIVIAPDGNGELLRPDRDLT